METKNKIRDLRLMQFSSLLRSLDVVSNARITQLYPWFLEFEKLNPLLDECNQNGYSFAIDHNNMKKFILDKKEQVFPKPKKNLTIKVIPSFGFKNPQHIIHKIKVQKHD